MDEANKEAAAQRAGASLADEGRKTYLGLLGVAAKFGVSERKAYTLVAEEWFPAPIDLGPRVRRWIEQEIDAAIAARAPRGLRGEPAQLTAGRARAKANAAIAVDGVRAPA